MAKYNLPALPKKKEPKGIDVPAMVYPDEYDRSVRIPITKEMIEAMTVGETVEIVLIGKVKGLESRDVEKGKNRAEVNLEITSVETEETNEFTKLAEDD